MEQTINKKKTGLFIAIVVIAEYLLRFCVFSTTLTAMPLNDASDYEKFNMISRIISLCITAVTIILTFVIGYVLTKDKKKTVIFAGSVYFGKNAANLIASLISAVANSLSYSGVLGASDMSTVISTGEVLVIPLIVAMAYFAFTAFEGTNPKLEGSLGSSEMLLSKARKRLIVAYLIAAAVSGVLTSAPSFVFAFVNIDMEYSYIMSIISLATKWLGTVLSFLIIYFAGYKPYKSHCDAMAFLSSESISIAISGFFMSVAMLPVSMLTQAVTKAENYQYMALLTGATSVISGIAFIIEILLIGYIAKFFFATAKITLFDTEAQAYGNPELTYAAESDFEKNDKPEDNNNKPDPYQQQQELHIDEE